MHSNAVKVRLTDALLIRQTPLSNRDTSPSYIRKWAEFRNRGKVFGVKGGNEGEDEGRDSKGEGYGEGKGPKWMLVAVPDREVWRGV